MNLNAKSWYVWIYKSTYGTQYLPNNLCTFFWKLVFALLLFPVMLIGHLINFIDEHYNEEFTMPALVFGLIVSIIVVCYMYNIYGHLSILQFLEYFYLVTIIVTTALVVFCGLFLFVLLLKDKISGQIYVRRAVRKQRRQWILPTYIKAWYNKNCPRIIWENRRNKI